MANEVFSFKKQLRVGNIGEELFLKHYKWSTKADGFKYDLTYRKRTVELKTDTYPLAKTPNFFMEKYGDVDKKKLGGPWRAARDEVHYFVYLFLSDSVFFWFRSDELVDFLDSHIKDLKGKKVSNKTYSSLGYCVPRDDLKHLLIRQDKV